MITLADVTRRYRQSDLSPALDNVSLEIQTGGFIAITGSSGSGKSTLLHLIAALDKPDNGRISIDNVDVSSLRERDLAGWRGRTVGLVFQAYMLLPTLTALENVIAPMEFTGLVSKLERREKARNLLTKFGLVNHTDKLPSQLSGGMQQRVGLARALACDPPYVLADEPTGNLDSGASTEVISALREIADHGRTVIMVTHDQKAASACDRVVNIVDGRVSAPQVAV